MGNQTAQTYLERIGAIDSTYRLLVGDVQSTGALFQGVTNGNTKSLYLENPTSDTFLILTAIEIRSSAKVLVDKAFNVTEDTQGNSPTTGSTNKRSDANGTDVIIRVGGDNETGAYSGGNSFSTKTAGGGGATPQISPGETADGLSNVVAPEDNILVSVTNDSGSDSDVSIDMDFVEKTNQDFP